MSSLSKNETHRDGSNPFIVIKSLFILSKQCPKCSYPGPPQLTLSILYSLYPWFSTYGLPENSFGSLAFFIGIHKERNMQKVTIKNDPENPRKYVDSRSEDLFMFCSSPQYPRYTQTLRHRSLINPAEVCGFLK